MASTGCATSEGSCESAFGLEWCLLPRTHWPPHARHPDTQRRLRTARRASPAWACQLDGETAPCDRAVQGDIVLLGLREFQVRRQQRVGSAPARSWAAAGARAVLRLACAGPEGRYHLEIRRRCGAALRDSRMCPLRARVRARSPVEGPQRGICSVPVTPSPGHHDHWPFCLQTRPAA